MKKILVPTAGTEAAYETAEYALQVAKSLRADLHVLHVLAEESEFDNGAASLEVFDLASEVFGVHVVGSVREGKVVQEIISYVDENQIDLVVMGASSGRVVNKWLSYDVLGRSGVPVLVMPFTVFEKSAY